MGKETAGAKITLVGAESYSYKGNRYVAGVVYIVAEALADDLLERSIDDEGDKFYFEEATRRHDDYEVVDLIANPRAKAGQQADRRSARAVDEEDDGDDTGAAAASGGVAAEAGDRRDTSQRGRRTAPAKPDAKAKKTIKVGGGAVQTEGGESTGGAGAEGSNKDEGAVEV